MKESVQTVHLWFYHGAFALLCKVERLITSSMILEYTTGTLFFQSNPKVFLAVLYLGCAIVYPLK